MFEHPNVRSNGNTVNSKENGVDCSVDVASNKTRIKKIRPRIVKNIKSLTQWNVSQVNIKSATAFIGLGGCCVQLG